MGRKVHKSTVKKTVKKSVHMSHPVSGTLTTYHKRNTNRISIIFPKGAKTLEDIELDLIKFDWSPIERQMKASKKMHPLTKRMEYVPPKSFYVILKLLKPRNIEQYYSEIAPVDMVVNLENVQDLTIEIINKLFESWTSAHDVMQDDDDIVEGSPIEYMDKLDMRYLKEIIYHFIYL